MTITPEAQKQLDTVLKSGEYLAIWLKGGGCGGARVTMTKEDHKSTYALSIAGTANVIFADKASQTYLTEGSLDIDNSVFNARFIFKPPLGTESCGCGSSIKIG
jgi:iron-sulfur cluster assembly accessory protein